jgi:hypothetical protein
MSRSSLRRLATVAAATAALTAVAVPSPALAGDLFFSKTSGTQVSVSWLEVGELPLAANVPGNAHFGDLFVDDLGNGRADVFGQVFDVQCDPGVTPYNPGGGHGEEPPADGPCDLLGVRFIDGGTVKFTLDKKLTKATLTGTLSVFGGHGEGPAGSAPVNITWTGVGATYTERVSGVIEDEFGTSRYRFTFTGRDADISPGSRIGPMVFDDEAGEFSDSRLGKYRQSDRTRL